MGSVSMLVNIAFQDLIIISATMVRIQAVDKCMEGSIPIFPVASVIAMEGQA